MLSGKDIFKEGSILHPLRKGRSLTAQLQQTGERLESDWGDIFELSGSERASNHWKIMINKR